MGIREDQNTIKKAWLGSSSGSVRSSPTAFMESSQRRLDLERPISKKREERRKENLRKHHRPRGQNHYLQQYGSSQPRWYTSWSNSIVDHNQTMNRTYESSNSRQNQCGDEQLQFTPIEQKMIAKLPGSEQKLLWSMSSIMDSRSRAVNMTTAYSMASLSSAKATIAEDRRRKAGRKSSRSKTQKRRQKTPTRAKTPDWQ